MRQFGRFRVRMLGLHSYKNGELGSQSVYERVFMMELGCKILLLKFWVAKGGEGKN